MNIGWVNFTSLIRVKPSHLINYSTSRSEPYVLKVNWLNPTIQHHPYMLHAIHATKTHSKPVQPIILIAFLYLFIFHSPLTLNKTPSSLVFL
jgi:hypothetical protein